MQKTLSKKDILGWDTYNWSCALEYWEKLLPKKKGLTCLEIGANKGGLSLWLASLGHNVVCNDYVEIKDEIKKYHNRFDLEGKISYEQFNILEIPYENHFDIIILKSVLGGVGRNNNEELIKKGIDQIYKALKDNGYFLFAENSKATKFHSVLRKRFSNWGSSWNYLEKDQLLNSLNKYSEVDLNTSGFLGAFGYNETFRQLLGNIDTLVFNKLPSDFHYIVYGYAKK